MGGILLPLPRSPPSLLLPCLRVLLVTSTEGQMQKFPGIRKYKVSWGRNRSGPILMSGKGRAIFFYFPSHPGIGLPILVKMPSPSVPRLRQHVNLTQAERWWPVNTEAPKGFLQRRELTRPLGAPLKMTEIYFSSGLKQIKCDLEGKKEEWHFLHLRILN